VADVVPSHRYDPQRRLGGRDPGKLPRRRAQRSHSQDGLSEMVLIVIGQIGGLSRIGAGESNQRLTGLPKRTRLLQRGRSAGRQRKCMGDGRGKIGRRLTHGEKPRFKRQQADRRFSGFQRCSLYAIW
jgi:hypothetical protein